MKNRENENTPVDFENPEALAEALASTEAATDVESKTKERKPAKPRIIKVSHVCDKDYAAGETIEFDFEVPKGAGGGRGALLGIAVEEMTEEQLKIEYRNANSVYYKTKKAGKNADSIARAEERLNKVKAVMEAKGIAPSARAAAQNVDATYIATLIKSGQVSVDDIQKLLDGAAE